MAECYVCHKTLPDKSFTELVEGMQDYRGRFDDWESDQPVLICNQCDEEIQEEE